MFKFNSDNIFAGYIKQLLASFNLPKYKVYTEEQRKYHEQYLASAADRAAKLERLEESKNAVIEVLNYNDEFLDTVIPETIEAFWTAGSSSWNAILETLAIEDEPPAWLQGIKDWLNERALSELLLEAETLFGLETTQVSEILLSEATSKELLPAELIEDTSTCNSVFANLSLVYLEIFVTLKIAFDNYNITAESINDAKNTIKELTAKIAEIKSITPELNILESSYRVDTIKYKKSERAAKYPKYMRYIPYIKGNTIQIYTPEIREGTTVYSENDWKETHNFGAAHDKIHKNNANDYVPKPYVYNLKIKNYTKNLKIQNNIYDSYTHEYLGDFLRFQRDFRQLNLMSLYNCFSNTLCPELDLSVKVSDSYTATFKTSGEDAKSYKIYMVPVKFFQNYTIAIDSETAVEMCCGLYGQYPYDDAINGELAERTYTCYNNMQFKDPKLFTAVNNLTPLTSLLNSTELAQHEDDLKLFIKLPINNSSTITILEGDYLGYGDFVGKLQSVTGSSSIIKKQTNYSVVNFEGNLDTLDVKLTTTLQLLVANTKESYPFADRLIEYLVDNVVTPEDTIGDNIKRAKVIAAKNTSADVITIVEDEIWLPALKYVYYNYINKKYNGRDFNHDILGYVDKDVEKFYAYVNKRIQFVNGVPTVVTTADSISTVNIYEEWEEK